MLGVECYTKNFDLQRSQSIDFLKRSAGLITNSPNDIVMDVGCGPGDVTTEILMPAISNQFKKLYGIDHSTSMIDHAKSQNSKDKRLIYLVIDIGVENATQQMKEQVNHLYSFYCFHWIQDQAQLFLNLYDLLVPGGDMLCKYGIKAVLTDVWGILKLSEKWSRFLHNAKIPFFGQTLTEIVSNLMSNLENAGFSYIISVKDQNFTFETDEKYRSAMKAVSPWLDSIPPNLQNEIMDDFMVETLKYNEQVIKLNKNIASRTCWYTDVEIFARKPL